MEYQLSRYDVTFLKRHNFLDMTQLSRYDITFQTANNVCHIHNPFPLFAAKKFNKIHTKHMKNTSQKLDLSPRPILRLAEIERLIRKHRIIVPPLTRRVLNAMCEDGTFETVGNAPTKLGWLVFEDSFVKWVKGLESNC